MTTQHDERAELIARLHAMAENYKNGHAWDNLDGKTVLQAAALLAADGQAGGEVVSWIDINERVPDRGTDCLILSQEPWEKTPSVKLDRWDEQHEAPLSWSSATVPIGEGWDNDSSCVTHWMPCPPACASYTHPHPQPHPKPQAVAQGWKLDKPAQVGGGVFEAGVSADLVIKAAQRNYETQTDERTKTPEQRREDEANRRAFWDMVNGPLSASPAAPAATPKAG